MCVCVCSCACVCCSLPRLIASLLASYREASSPPCVFACVRACVCCSLPRLIASLLASDREASSPPDVLRRWLPHGQISVQYRPSRDCEVTRISEMPRLALFSSLASCCNSPVLFSSVPVSSLVVSVVTVQFSSRSLTAGTKVNFKMYNIYIWRYAQCCDIEIKARRHTCNALLCPSR
jgi:hypothetical protein